MDEQELKRLKENEYDPRTTSGCCAGSGSGRGGMEATKLGWAQPRPPSNHSWNIPRPTSIADHPTRPAVEEAQITPTREFVLRLASAAINGPREESYGSPSENFSTIARLWSVYLGYTIMPEDVAILMVLLKAARAKNGEFNLDTYVDIAGYAALGAEVATEQAW